MANEWRQAVLKWWWERRRPATDYVSTVENLIRIHGVEQAMEIAVGGSDAIGDRELLILDYFGLRDGDYLIDVGCGSGRLTRRAARLPKLRYLGTDVSKPLVEHARATCGRDDFRFSVVDGLTIPERDETADMVAFFSVGTHLLSEQFFVNLEEARRVLRPGGRIVLSFLDMETRPAKKVFEQMVERARKGQPEVPLNVFFPPSTVRTWARMLGMECIEIVGPMDWRSRTNPVLLELIGSQEKQVPFGQSVAALEKPKRPA